jgi:hypothetical protein
MNILIGGDVVPTKSNELFFESGQVQDLIGDELVTLFKQQDCCLLNLETPLCEKGSPIHKCGPVLMASPKNVVGLKVIDPFFFGLANNHILDQGDVGLFSTIETLKNAHLSFCGAGKNFAEARKPWVFEKNGEKIGVYCCAEHEFSIATEDSCGANPFDPLNSFDDIKSLKEKVDHVIVLYHGGHEQYRYPSPNLQRRCRKFVDCGANLVVCQHSHCIGCKEDYLQGCIVYGQGNFLFDMEDNEYWNTSLLILASFSLQGVSLRFLPIEKYKFGVRASDEGKSNEVLASFLKRSEEIKKPGVIEKKYQDFACSLREDYLGSISGNRYRSFLFRAINKITRGHLKKALLRKKFRDSSALCALNLVSCESHSELLSEILKNSKQ